MGLGAEGVPDPKKTRVGSLFFPCRLSLSRHSPPADLSGAFSSNSRADQVGLPVLYTMRGNELEFAPKPDSAYILQMLYYYKPTDLSSGNASNSSNHASNSSNHAANSSNFANTSSNHARPPNG